MNTVPGVDMSTDHSVRVSALPAEWQRALNILIRIFVFIQCSATEKLKRVRYGRL